MSTHVRKQTAILRAAAIALSAACSCLAQGITAGAKIDEATGTVQVTVTLPASQAKGTLSLRAGNKSLGSLRTEKDGDKATAKGALAMPPLNGLDAYKSVEVKVGSKLLTTFSLPLGEINWYYTGYPSGFLGRYLAFEKYVFTGSAFPRVKLLDRTGRIPDFKALLGDYTITTTWYGRDLQKVDAPTGPGRYGLVVNVKCAGDKVMPATAVVCMYTEDTVGSLPAEARAAARKNDEKGARLLAAAYDKSLHGAEGEADAIDQAWQEKFLAASGIKVARPAAPQQAAGYPYAVSKPPDYDKDPSKKWPLIVHMHGGGYAGSPDRLLQIFGAYARERFIVVALKNGGGGWWNVGHTINITKLIMNSHRVDPDRVFVTGHSLGGMGAFHAAAGAPDLYAGLVSMDGVKSPSEVCAIFKEKNVAVWLMCGDYDYPNVDDADRFWMHLVRAGAHARYTRMAGWGHSGEWYALPRREIFDWMLAVNKKGSSGEVAAAPKSGGAKSPAAASRTSKLKGMKKDDARKDEAKKTDAGAAAAKKDAEAKGDAGAPAAAAEPDFATAYAAALAAFNKKDWSAISTWIDQNQGVRNGPPLHPEIKKMVDFWPWYETDAATAFSEKHGLDAKKYYP